MKPMSSVLPASLLPLVLAGVVTLGGSGTARADLYAFGNTSSGYGSLTLDGSLAISTRGNQGWVAPSGGNHTAGAGHSTNYLVGSCSAASGCQANDHNNYFVFGLAGQSHLIHSATLTLHAGEIVGAGTYYIYDVTSLAPTLLAGPTSPNPTLYNELATAGPLIGDIGFGPSDNGGTITLTLNSVGLADLNWDIAHGVANFAIGGSLSLTATDFVSVPAPLTGGGLLQSLGVLGFVMYAAARRGVRARRAS